MGEFALLTGTGPGSSFASPFPYGCVSAATDGRSLAARESPGEARTPATKKALSHETELSQGGQQWPYRKGSGNGYLPARTVPASAVKRPRMRQQWPRRRSSSHGCFPATIYI